MKAATMTEIPMSKPQMESLKEFGYCCFEAPPDFFRYKVGHKLIFTRGLEKIKVVILAFQKYQIKAEVGIICGRLKNRPKDR